MCIAQSTLRPLLDEVANLPLPAEEVVPTHPPPVPRAGALRPATLAVGHFHSVLSRGAGWWTSRKAKVADRAAATSSGSDSPSAAGRGLHGLGERAGPGSSVWAVVRGGGGGGGGGTEELGNRKKELGKSLSTSGKLGAGSSSSLGGSGAGSGAGAGVGVAVAVGAGGAAMSSLDEFHASPRLRFQLLLREQGVIVTLFDAMETVRLCLMMRKEGEKGNSCWYSRFFFCAPPPSRRTLAMRPPSPGVNEALLFPLDSVDIQYTRSFHAYPV